jgi:negative regulator of flagellin synthesis FlgM
MTHAVAAERKAKVLRTAAVTGLVRCQLKLLRKDARMARAQDALERPDPQAGDRTVTSKIGGYGNRPVQTGADKTVARERDAATSASKSAQAGKPATPVRITDQARQLAALERAVHDTPVVNDARVAAVRTALEEGRYEVSPERIADKLLRMEQELLKTEK